MRSFLCIGRCVVDVTEARNTAPECALVLGKLQASRMSQASRTVAANERYHVHSVRNRARQSTGRGTTLAARVRRVAPAGYTLHASIGAGLPDLDSDPFNVTL